MAGYIGSKAVNLNTTGGTIKGSLTVTGTAVTLDSASVQTVDLGDNDRIRLGDGDDLQLYYDSSTSDSHLDVTGNFTVDSSGIIKLDTDSGEVQFIDGGTEYVQLKKSGNDVQMTAGIADGDIVFRGNDSTTGMIAALNLDMSNAGAANFNSSVTASGPIQALGGQDLRAFSSDNSVFISIKHNEIDASGNLTLDVASDIILDAENNGKVQLHDGGTYYGLLRRDNNDFQLYSIVQDGDMVFRGNDGGGNVTALTLDMSEAGAATFNSTVTANAGVVVDNITIDGTEIDLSSGDLTIDVAGNIKLDADSGLVYLSDNGTDIGLLNVNNEDLTIRNLRPDRDIVFQGNDSDGSSQFTAFELDMSDAGTATFNHDVKLPDSGELSLGAGGDLKLYHNGSHSFIKNITGDLNIENNSSIYIDSTHEIILDADGGVFRFKDNATEILNIANDSSDVHFNAKVADKDIVFRGIDGSNTIDALTLDMSAAGRATFNGDLIVPRYIEHAGDTDTFIGFSAADQFDVTAGAVEQIRMTGSGGVTINNGQNSNVNLTVKSGSIATAFQIDGSSGNATFGGNLAIGAASAGQRLEVADSNGGVAAIRIRRTDVTDSDVDLRTGDGSTGKDFTIHVNQAERVRIADSGNLLANHKIGIGLGDSSLANDCDLSIGSANPAIFFHDTTGGAVNAAMSVNGGIITFSNNSTGSNLSDQTARMTIGRYGHVDIVDGDLRFDNGHGISFADTAGPPDPSGSGASATNEILNDYEEGSWAPVITPEGGSAASLSVNHATYTKIGRMVFVQFDVKIVSISGTNSNNAIELSGLPYSRNTTAAGGPNIGYTNLTASMTGTLALQGHSTTMYRIVNLAGETGLNASDHLTANTFLRGQFSYNT